MLRTVILWDLIVFLATVHDSILMSYLQCFKQWVQKALQKKKINKREGRNRSMQQMWRTRASESRCCLWEVLPYQFTCCHIRLSVGISAEPTLRKPWVNWWVLQRNPCMHPSRKKGLLCASTKNHSDPNMEKKPSNKGGREAQRENLYLWYMTEYSGFVFIFFFFTFFNMSV